MEAIKKESVTFRIDSGLKKVLETVADMERRSLSNQINLALEEWTRIKGELHAQFIKDIKEALEYGKPEPVWKG